MVIKNKRGFLARDWMVALVLFSGVIAIMFIMSSDFLTSYGEADKIDPSINETYNTFQEDTDSISTAFEAASDKEGLNTLGTFNLIFQSTFTVITQVFNSVERFGGVITSMGEDFGIPSEISAIILTLGISVITIIIVFIIISSLGGRL